MSILITGSTRCPLCGEVIATSEEALQFPAFAWAENDPLWQFSDASVHTTCFASDPRRVRVESVVAELMAKTGPGNRLCAVCQTQVVDPEDYLMLPRLTHDEANPLFRFRYTHLHKSHVPNWRAYDDFMLLLRRSIVDVPWVAALIDELERARRGETK